jgi:hypothetical protein
MTSTNGNRNVFADWLPSLGKTMAFGWLCKASACTSFLNRFVAKLRQPSSRPC